MEKDNCGKPPNSKDAKYQPEGKNHPAYKVDRDAYRKCKADAKQKGSTGNAMTGVIYGK